MTISLMMPGDFVQISSLRDASVNLALMRRSAADPLTLLIRQRSPAPMDRVDATIDFRFKPDSESRGLPDIVADEESGKRAPEISRPAQTFPIAPGGTVPAPLADSKTTWRTIPTRYGAVIACRNPNAGFLYEMDHSNKVQITARAVERRYLLCFRQSDGRYRVMGSVYYRGDSRCDRESDALAIDMLRSLVLTAVQN